MPNQRKVRPVKSAAPKHQGGQFRFKQYFRLLRDALRYNCDEEEWHSHALGLVRNKDLMGLLSLAESLMSQQYTSAAKHFRGTQFAALIDKIKCEIPGVKPDSKALEKFLEGEMQCARTNRRIMHWGRISWERRPHARAILYMREYLLRIFGEEPPLSKIFDSCDFSGGSNVGVTGSATNLYRKLHAEEFTVTPPALSYVREALYRNEQFAVALSPGKGDIACLDYSVFSAELEKRAVRVNYNVLEFVPKKATCSRTIAKEPVGNGFVQKGVDLVMRGLLVRAGIDLSNQELNKFLAREGSQQWDSADPYVTLDVRNASGTQAVGLVKLVAPSSWFRLWDNLRSPSYVLKDSSPTRYECFTSMGNGFCFPLESAIFAAFCYAAAKVNGHPADFRVYGDDIIVRRSIALYLIELLSYFGFETNRDKSFIHGPFRESCGADWYDGQDVRPVYLKDFASDYDVYAFHNSTYRSPLCSLYFGEIRETLRSPDALMRPGEDPGDTCFSVPFDVFLSCRHARWSRAEQRWEWREAIPKVVRDKGLTPQFRLAEYLAVLRGSSSSAPLAKRFTTARTIRKVWSVPSQGCIPELVYRAQFARALHYKARVDRTRVLGAGVPGR